MAKKKSDPFAKWHFIAIPATAEMKRRVNAAYEQGIDWYRLLDDLAHPNHKLTIAWKPHNKAFSIVLTDVTTDSPNARTSMGAMHGDIAKGLLMLCFALEDLSGEPWARLEDTYDPFDW